MGTSSGGDPGQQTLGTTPVKDTRIETLIALTGEDTEPLVDSRPSAPHAVLQDRNPSRLDLCEDFGWRGRRK